MEQLKIYSASHFGRMHHAKQRITTPPALVGTDLTSPAYSLHPPDFFFPRLFPLEEEPGAAKASAASIAASPNSVLYLWEKSGKYKRGEKGVSIVHVLLVLKKKELLCQGELVKGMHAEVLYRREGGF